MIARIRLVCPPQREFHSQHGELRKLAVAVDAEDIHQELDDVSVLLSDTSDTFDVFGPSSVEDGGEELLFVADVAENEAGTATTGVGD